MLSRQKTINHLFNLTNQGIKYDLARIEKAAESIGTPYLSYPSIHVAGTNGKGSVCAMIESILRQAGVRTGLFTSPHLINFEERFIIDGIPVKTPDWLEVYESIKPVCDSFKLSFFETSTLIAFELFRRAKIDMAVIETGLGGRLDATNIIAPQVSVITAIDKDHASFLGTDITGIAREKLGIVKNGTPLIMQSSPIASITETAKKICAEKNAPLSFVCNSAVEIKRTAPLPQEFIYEDIPFRLPLNGTFQITNALTALKAVSAIGISDTTAMQRGLAQTRIPGRFQRIEKQEKTIIFDIAHNPGAAQSLAGSLRLFCDPSDLCVITGIMADKEIRAILTPLCTVCNHIIFTEPAIPRACSVSELPSFLPKESLRPFSVVADCSQAVQKALQRPEKIICITGSFYTVGECMTALGIEPYEMDPVK